MRLGVYLMSASPGDSGACRGVFFVVLLRGVVLTITGPHTAQFNAKNVNESDTSAARSWGADQNMAAMSRVCGGLRNSMANDCLHALSELPRTIAASESQAQNLIKDLIDAERDPPRLRPVMLRPSSGLLTGSGGRIPHTVTLLDLETCEDCHFFLQVNDPPRANPEEAQED